MTGHQPNPANGITLKGEKTKKLDLVAISKACGVTNVHTVDPFDLKTVETILKEALKAPEPSVIIAQRPCFLLKSYKPEVKLVHINRDKCVKCGVCWKLGCPAIEVSPEDGKTIINTTLCVHCGLCAAVCRPGAITQEKGEK
jgi:indolepyruvate ferredoxin oxidoreductase alpha subunit